MHNSAGGGVCFRAQALEIKLIFNLAVVALEAGCLLPGPEDQTILSNGSKSFQAQSFGSDNVQAMQTSFGCLGTGHKDGRTMSSLRWNADTTFESKYGLRHNTTMLL